MNSQRSEVNAQPIKEGRSPDRPDRNGGLETAAPWTFNTHPRQLFDSERFREQSASTVRRFNGSIELNIEELVLHGFAPRDSYAIGDAVEREIARLLMEQGVPISLQSDKATDEITGATFNAKPRKIGQQIAEAVYRGFSR